MKENIQVAKAEASNTPVDPTAERREAVVEVTNTTDKAEATHSGGVGGRGGSGNAAGGRVNSNNDVVEEKAVPTMTRTGSWSRDQVADWLKQNDLEHLTEK